MDVDDRQRPDTDSEEDDDPSDPVVKTIPIYFTAQMAKHSMLLEYPHKKPVPSSNRHPLLPPTLRSQVGISDENTTRITARMKPKVGKLELSVPLEAEQNEDQLYNKQRGNYMASGVDASADLGLEKPVKTRKRDREQFEDSYKMLTRMSLRGEVLPDQTNYCVAVLKDDALHCTPLTQTLQMRPELTYLDRLAARSRQSANPKGGALGMDTDPNLASASDSDDAEDDERKQRREAARAARVKAMAAEARAVQVSVKNEASAASAGGGMYKGVATGRQDGSLFAPLRAEESETWTYLDHHPCDSAKSDRIWENFFANMEGRLELETETWQHLTAPADRPATLIV